MFKLFNSIVKLPSVKPIASKSFLDALEAVKDIQILSDEIKNDRNKSASDYFNQALEIFEELKNDSEMYIDDYHDCAEFFIQSLEYKRNNPETYTYLSLIFYTLGNINSSIQYMRVAKSFDYHSEHFDRLNELIDEDGVENMEKERNSKEGLENNIISSSSTIYTSKLIPPPIEKTREQIDMDFLNADPVLVRNNFDKLFDFKD